MSPAIFGEVLFDCFKDGSRILGGAPFNVAWHLTAFGQAPLMISGLGEDEYGADILARMRAWEMQTTGMQIIPGCPTGQVQVSFHQGEPHYEIVKPVAWDRVDVHQLPDVSKAPLLYHGTLALRSEMSRQALSFLKQQSHSPLFLDVNLRDPWWNAQHVLRLIEDAYWVKLNQQELRELFPDSATDQDALQHLFNFPTVHFVLLTKGKDGAELLHRDGGKWQIKPAQQLRVVDTVGAGDAFTSIFLLGILLDWPEQQSMQRAQDFASAVVGLRGATTNDITFYHNFRQHWGL